jgi:hypothetical protein
VKRPGHEADHSHPSSAEVKECVELYIHSTNTSSWRGAQLKHRDNFTFYLYLYLTPEGKGEEEEEEEEEFCRKNGEGGSHILIPYGTCSQVTFMNPSRSQQRKETNKQTNMM